jgi:hypothetical protein
MEELSDGRLFFMAVGFKKRHLKNYPHVSSPRHLYTISDAVPDIVWQESYEISYKEEHMWRRVV